MHTRYDVQEDFNLDETLDMNYTKVEFGIGKVTRTVTVAHKGPFAVESWCKQYPDRVLLSMTAILIGKDKKAAVKA